MAPIKKCTVVLSLLIAVVWLNGCAAKFAAVSSTSSGKSGSMARFTIKDDVLYTVSEDKLHIFDLKEKSQPQKVNAFNIGWGIETIFSYKDLLFFGTRTGMIIYNIEEAQNPVYYGRYDHIYSCDPIVVEDGVAYVTLRSQAQCRQGKNELHLYDIVDPTSPILIKTYPMKNPWGLGVDGKKLFVCDGKYGLKVFDAKDPNKLKQIENIDTINGYDVIPNNGILIVSARDGIYQFEYSKNKMKKLSRIPVGY